MKKNILLILVCMYCGFAAGQPSNQVPNITSPDVSNLGKYGIFPVNLYTGTIDISIPLYEINLGNVSVPVTLSYDASGFLPNKNSGIVGQNWTLSAGGIITRSVNGIPDEQEFPYITTSGLLLQNYQRYGYWYGIKTKESPKTAEYINNLSYINTSAITLNVNLPYEHTPDIFTFNFCGHSGQFLIGNDGQIKVIADEPYQVDLSGLSYQRGDRTIKDSQIKIKSKDGYEFIFGGTLQNLEINLASYEFNTQTHEHIPLDRGVITAWYLVKINTPYQETINFTYEDQDVHNYLAYVEMGPWSNYGADKDFIDKIYYNHDYVYYNVCVEEKTGGIFSMTGSQGNLFNRLTPRQQTSFVKLAYLKEITFPQGKISFKYSEKPYHFYGNHREAYWRNSLQQTGVNTKKLDSIKIVNRNNQIEKSIALQYANKNASGNFACYRMFLTDVSINDIQKYSLLYNNDNLPDPLTSSVDFWGYYNGNTSMGNYLIPSVNVDNFADPDFSFRNTNKDYNNIGMLYRITYPTGGYTTFTFETNDYSKALKRRNISDNNSTMSNETGFAGGLRIQKITHSSGEYTEYKYLTDEGTSSGIVINNAIYCIKSVFESSIYGCYRRIFYVMSSDNIISVTSIQEPHIGYSKVREIKGNGNNGYTDYYYSSHLTNPDLYFKNAQIFPNTSLNVNDFMAQARSLMKYSSKARERGKLTKLKIINSADGLLKEESYIYNNNENRFQDAVITYNIPFWDSSGQGCFQSYAIYCYPNSPTQKKLSENFANNTVETTENHSYNSNRMLRESYFYQSDGKKIGTKYIYSDDKTDNISNSMTNKFMIGIPVEKLSLKNDLVVSAEKTEYQNISNMLLPKIIYASNMSTPSSQTTYQNFYNPELYYDTYNTYGKATQIHNASMNTVYLWSYNSQYPIAEIKNATYSQVEQILTSALINRVTSADTPAVADLTAIKNLRTNTNLSGAMVTVYEYKPLVGMTSMTDPHGVTIYYEYDNFGRLKTVKDSNGKAIKTYDYHYKN